MSLKNKVRELMTEALRSGNKNLKEIYASILNSLLNKEKELKSELTSEQEIEVITKLFKSINESIETCPTDRVETLEGYQNEREVISSFMPKQLNEVEIKEVIQEVLDSLNISSPTIKDKGLVMKSLMPLIKCKADGKLVNKVLESMFSL